MADDKITSKQQEILEYIKNTILKKGYPPAVREICEAVNLKSTSSVHSHLSALEEKGYIRRDPTKPRTIEILDDTFNFNRREMVNIPLVGTVAAGEPILAEERIEDYFPFPAEMLPNAPVFRRSTRKIPSFSSCHFFISSPASRFFLYLQQIFNALWGFFY